MFNYYVIQKKYNAEGEHTQKYRYNINVFK